MPCFEDGADNGGGVALFSSHYFCKDPGSTQAVLWHSDGSYWPQLEPMDKVATLWLAIDSSDRENGCLRVVPGSHRWPLRSLTDDTSESNVLGSRTHSDDEIDESEVVDLELAPGDVSMHHPSLIHGSLPNRSTRRRCGLTIRYMTADTHCTDQDQPVMMMRGSPHAGTPNAYRSWPAFRGQEDREAYYAFEGCDEWNDGRRREGDAEEEYLLRTPVDQLHGEVKAGLESFVRGLGGHIG